MELAERLCRFCARPYPTDNHRVWYCCDTCRRLAKNAAGRDYVVRVKPYQQPHVLAKIADARRQIEEIKTTRGCADCGWNEHHAALDFDHGDSPKRWDIGRLRHMSRTVREEIDKCEVVCANCHRIREARRRGL